jgi:hypothetical protein
MGCLSVDPDNAPPASARMPITRQSAGHQIQAVSNSENQLLLRARSFAILACVRHLALGVIVHGLLARFLVRFIQIREQSARPGFNSLLHLI